MADAIKNYVLMNAPAGSGKTTKIKSMVRKFMLESPQDNILCITYTNRAAEELAGDLRSEHIFVGTIHSFLHSFMRRYFAHPDILSLYFEQYGETIKRRIENAAGEEHVMEGNEKYKEKYGQLDYETVRRNLTKVFYNESPFNSLYYGGLSHDDLVSFSKCIFDRFPVLRRRIALRYQHIFIDEYQDTVADVLNIFYDAVAETNSKLYLFGDRMQQIYLNYDGSFEERFAQFEMERMDINHRSVSEIVDILNRLYQDPEFAQETAEDMREITPDFPPRVMITNDVSSSLTKLQEDDPDALILYLFNKERFSAIGASNLFRVFSTMEKYSFGKSHSAVEVLTTLYRENPDPMLKLLYCVTMMAKEFQEERYGLVIQTLKSNRFMFDQKSCDIRKHSDKIELFENLKSIFTVVQDETKTIQDLLSLLRDTSIIDGTYLENMLVDAENGAVLTVPAIEPMRVLDYLDDPRVSTQHGVKGESHNSVIFVADNSNRSAPIVYMYRFFELLSQVPVSLRAFNQFYYSYVKELTDLENMIGMKVSELKADDYAQYGDKILQKGKAIADHFSDDPYFRHICQDKYKKYLDKPGVTRAKDCLKESSVLGVLSAYKLFYVGCSRARRNLTILLDYSKLQGNVQEQKKKFVELGFSVEEMAV